MIAMNPRFGVGSTSFGLGQAGQSTAPPPTQYSQPNSSGYSGVLSGTPNYSSVGRNNYTAPDSNAKLWNPAASGGQNTNTSAPGGGAPSVPGGAFGSYGSDPFSGMNYEQALNSFYAQPGNQYTQLPNALPSQGNVNNFNLQSQFNNLWANHQALTQGNPGQVTALAPSLSFDQFYNGVPLTQDQQTQMASAMGPNGTLMQHLGNNGMGQVGIGMVTGGPYANPNWNATTPQSMYGGNPFSFAGLGGGQQFSQMFDPRVAQLYGGNPFGLLSQYSNPYGNMGSVANLINQVQGMGGGLTSSQFGNGFSPALSYSALNPLFFGQGGSMMPFGGGGMGGGYNPMNAMYYPQIP